MSQLVLQNPKMIFDERGLWACSRNIRPQGDFERRFFTMMVRGICDTDDEKGIGTTQITDHTPLQYGDIFCYELRWLVWRLSKINMIRSQVAFFPYDFLVIKLVWNYKLYTHVWLCCVGFFNFIDQKCRNGSHTHVAEYKISLYSVPPFLHICITLISSKKVVVYKHKSTLQRTHHAVSLHAHVLPTISIHAHLTKDHHVP